MQSWTVFERAYDDWHLLLMPYGHERLGAVGGRITSYSYTNTPFPLWAPRLILLEALSSPGGGRKSNQRRLTVEIALRIPTRTR